MYLDGDPPSNSVSSLEPTLLVSGDRLLIYGKLSLVVVVVFLIDRIELYTVKFQPKERAIN